MAATMKRLLMCMPKYFHVAYRINPWMKDSAPVDLAKANEQWVKLKLTLQKCGAKIDIMEPGETAKNVPDLVFTANAALVRGRLAYLAHFFNAERQPERSHNENWFINNGFQTLGTTDIPFEGAGDALHSTNDKLFAGYGPRTDVKIYDKISADFDANGAEPFRTILCRLVDPQFYHIDTCFCPIDTETAIWVPGAFDQDSREIMRKHIDLIEVPDANATKFACNSVAVGKNVVMPAGNDDFAGKLENRGFSVHPVDVSEFIKAGGACKCLTLQLE